MKRIGLLTVLAFFGAQLSTCWAASDWGPTPNQRPYTPKRRTVMRSLRLEMGEIVSVSGQPLLFRGQQSTEDDRSQPSSRTAEQGEELRVGDTVQVGDTIVTDGAGSLEVLFGTNGRLRLHEKSRLVLQQMSEVPLEGKAQVRRRVQLDHGALRIRVRENTVRPAPVLVIGIGGEVQVGRPGLNVPGGVDVVVTRAPGQATGELQVLNGSAFIRRDGTLDRPPDQLTIPQGRGMTVPSQKEKMPLPGSLAELKAADLHALRHRFAFSHEPMGRKPIAPQHRNRELDGP